MLQNICFVDNIKIRRQIFIGLPLFDFELFLNVLYFSGFSNVISTRETGTQHILLIDPDDSLSNRFWIPPLFTFNISKLLDVILIDCSTRLTYFS